MKERILLFTIVFGLGVFVYIFQSYFNTVWGLALLCTFMFSYAMFMNLAYKLQERKLGKHPQVINRDYKPFVTVMIPAHDEEGIGENGVAGIIASNPSAKTLVGINKTVEIIQKIFFINPLYLFVFPE